MAEENGERAVGNRAKAEEEDLVGERRHDRRLPPVLCWLTCPTGFPARTIGAIAEHGKWRAQVTAGLDALPPDQQNTPEEDRQ